MKILITSILLLLLSLNLFCISNHQQSGEGYKIQWHFNSNSGSTAYDTSPNTNNGIVNGGLAWAEDGVLGGCLDFPRIIHNAVSIAGAPNVTTISFGTWFNTDVSVASSFYSIISNNNLTGDFAYGFRMGYNILEFYIYAPSYVKIDLPLVLEVGKWYHAVGTFEQGGSNPNWKLYLNGELVETGYNTSLINTTKGGYFMVGSIWHDGNFGWDGKIDDVFLIDDRILSAAEIKNIYADQVGGHQ